MKSGTVKHAVLGVVPTDISPQVAQQFSLSTAKGALVLDAQPGGPAKKAGIQPGDIITKFAGTPINNALELTAALRQKEPGQKVDVVVLPGQDNKTFNVTPGQHRQIAATHPGRFREAG
ncbi:MULTISPECIES: PDZ domain-containing protein [unclassified Arthrobacter]|uniref:S1C family serine protease n=1 Tax=unclassified Arthrobacter TaxID=235627 RepID=UPI00339B9B5D